MTIDLNKFHGNQLELPLTFKQLQEEHKEWSKYNFDAKHPDPDEFWKPVFGVMEELGELCHALLKKSQGIRGSAEYHDEKVKDAVGDITVFLASTCSALGIDWQAVIENEWPNVKARDYKKDIALKSESPKNEATKITINGDVFNVYSEMLTYDQIVLHANPDANAGILYTIVATWKGNKDYEHGACTVTPGQRLRIVPNMRIEVAHTGNA